MLDPKLINWVLEILIVLFFAHANATATYFWSFAIGINHDTGHVIAGRIFSRIGFWILKHHDRYAESVDKKLQTRLEKATTENAIWKATISQKVNPFKAMGYCNVCTNIWMGILTAPIIFHLCDLPELLYLPYILISNASLRRIANK